MFCPKCGAQYESGAVCAACGEPLPPLPGPEDSREGGLSLKVRLVSLIAPANTSGWAIAAGYAGLFAVFLAFFFVPGPIAIVLGIVALRDLKRNPWKFFWKE